METKEYLQSLDEETLKGVSAYMVRDQFGIAHPDTNQACGSDNCDGHTGCSSSLPNYYCACVNGNCVAIPET